ncbi:GTPase RsgA [Planosporangium thailandense]|uniref:GTPase RsgA n=1 Tax=Planosporangium thailandense TaxID=765197 RepID=A0ABX0XX92_9ACTN|nr:GTPase RsgA [Planosporangium thailandense]NJC70428.1 GTPase RsgA [Planosporangium thailandense]
MTFDLGSLGWDPSFAAAYAGYDRPSRRPGRVMRVDRGVCTVLGESGAVRASLAGAVLAAAACDPGVLPCAGDWVVVHTWPDRRVTVESVLPRRNAVGGGGRYGRPLAANLDAVAVVEPLEPAPDGGRIARLLAPVAAAGVTSVVVLTTAGRGDARPRPVAPGVPVHVVDVRTGAGLAHLRRYTGRGRTLGLLGSSRAARAGVVDALAGATVLTTQALRADGRGRRTTSLRGLIPVPGGGVVIDTPEAEPADLPAVTLRKLS